MTYHIIIFTLRFFQVLGALALLGFLFALWWLNRAVERDFGKEKFEG